MKALQWWEAEKTWRERTGCHMGTSVGFRRVWLEMTDHRKWAAQSALNSLVEWYDTEFTTTPQPAITVAENYEFPRLWCIFAARAQMARDLRARQGIVTS